MLHYNFAVSEAARLDTITQLILRVVNLVRQCPLHSLRNSLLRRLWNNRILTILSSMSFTQSSRLRRVRRVVNEVR